MKTFLDGLVKLDAGKWETMQPAAETRGTRRTTYRHIDKIILTSDEAVQAVFLMQGLEMLRLSVSGNGAIYDWHAPAGSCLIVLEGGEPLSIHLHPINASAEISMTFNISKVGPPRWFSQRFEWGNGIETSHRAVPLEIKDAGIEVI